MKKIVLAWLVLGVHNAHAGTYGSFERVQKGYTVSVDIPIGSMSGPDPGAAEAAALKRRRDEVARELAPQFPLYENVFRRVLDSAHPYKAWLDVLDATRATANAEDYRARLPAPFRNQNDVILGEPMLYLHVAPKASLIAQGRALVGFALAQAFLANDGFSWPESPATANLGDALARVEKSDFYSGQAIAVAALVLDPRATAPALAVVLANTKAPATERLLARLILHGKNRDAFGNADWALLEQARRAGSDPRTLSTWVLLFAAPDEKQSLTAQLRDRLLVGDDFVKELTGKK